MRKRLYESSACVLNMEPWEIYTQKKWLVSTCLTEIGCKSNALMSSTGKVCCCISCIGKLFSYYYSRYHCYYLKVECDIKDNLSTLGLERNLEWKQKCCYFVYVCLFPSFMYHTEIGFRLYMEFPLHIYTEIPWLLHQVIRWYSGVCERGSERGRERGWGGAVVGVFFV